ncbi:hypothetical protein BMI86_10145 [Thioclava sp. DLFJ5-1]|uniref:YqaJ viral recombinase family nuclease n=1 Tax=Thioclava sp. DLFJ5-1 TaxID=1915314 RepID=UPI000998D7AC|nr:YqaJ viral recombinase family protein [Thioclava sp. DLFJ5-1]OOY20858.1 hypothetical protein BMI86_10145 [Thioclava sp. DLFJ5-1]
MSVEPSRAEFLRARQKGIGGSDIAAICGLSKYQTPYGVWESKTQPIDFEAEERKYKESPWLYWGQLLEELVAKEYAKRMGVKVQRVNAQMQHPDYPFAVANIDRAVVNPKIAGTVRWKDYQLTTDRLLECKTANGFASSLWGEEGTDDVPESYLLQTHWYMGITKTERTDIAVLIGGSDWRNYTVHADPEMFASLLERAAAFWELVEAKVAPDPQTVADAMARWPKHVAKKELAATVETAQSVDRYTDLKDQIKALEKEAEAEKVKICTAFGDSEILTDMGSPIATWKTQANNRFDAKALKADHPEIHSLYLREGTNRVLRIKEKKEQAE